MELNRLSLNDLNSLQRRTYNRIANGEVNIDTADERELNVILDLIELGVLDHEGDIVADNALDIRDDSYLRQPSDEFDDHEPDFDLEDDDLEYDSATLGDVSGVPGDKLREPDNNDIDFTNLR